MQITTKYNVGDTVWFINMYNNAVSGKIHLVNAAIKTDGESAVTYGITMSQQPDTSRHEDRLYPTKQSCLIGLAEQYEAEAKELREQAGTIEETAHQ